MEERVAEGILRAMFARRFAMLQLLRLKLGDIGGQFGIIVAKLRQLLGVVAVDFRLDGVGTGHCGPLAEQGRSGAKRKSGNAPEGLKRGRPNPAVGHEPVETL